MSFARKVFKPLASILTSLFLLTTVGLAPAQAQDSTASPTPLMKLSVRVIDSSKQPVNDARQEDFQVFEDGVPQTVSFFSKDDLPLSYGLVIDSSGSLRTQINQVLEAGQLILRSNKPEDETFISSFTQEIEMTQEITTNKATLLSALDTLKVRMGQTALIDALYLSADYLAQKTKSSGRRRALILVSDGEDRNSFYKEDKLVEILQTNDVQVFIIGLINELDREGGLIKRSARDRATQLLERIAKESGGRVFYPRSRDDILEMAVEIMRDLRSQYVLGYSPAPNPKSKKRRKIKVTVAAAPDGGKRTAFTRTEYLSTTKP
jgi:Ca-activated chloride channel family protein